ncbi:MAG: hypothetical protein NTX33_04605 [Propionibacteriales bacterium]|nr:hypothetical protein [Propionibacteriales bacterium]
MSILKNRTIAVVAGAAVLVGLGATGATAARLITSADIKNSTIQSVDVAYNSLKGTDIANSSLTGVDLANGTVGLIDLSADAKSALAPGDGILGVEADSIAAPKAITNIGGPINANYTNLDTGFTLPAGKYLITVDGSFESASVGDPAVSVYPQLSLWLDKSGDDAFQWQQGEGNISPNALMPTAKDRHISVSGTSVVVLDDDTYVGLLAFGYASDQSAARSGEINVTGATITATPLN